MRGAASTGSSWSTARRPRRSPASAGAPASTRTSRAPSSPRRRRGRGDSRPRTTCCTTKRPWRRSRRGRQAPPALPGNRGGVVERGRVISSRHSPAPSTHGQRRSGPVRVSVQRTHPDPAAPRDLFDKLLYFCEQQHSYCHHTALLTLFEILEVTSRADLKSDLLQELERHRQTLQALRNNPQVSEAALAAVLGEIEHAQQHLNATTGKAGSTSATTSG